jgi:hypothetical protein
MPQSEGAGGYIRYLKYVYTVFENLTYRSGQPYTYSLPPDQAFTENKGVEQGHIFITTSLSIY